MRYTLDRETLSIALRCTEPVLSANDYNGSRDFLIDLSDEGVLLAGSNGIMMVQAQFAHISGESNFRAIVNRKLAIAADSMGDSITLRGKKTGDIRCIMGDERLDLQSSPPEVFHDFPTYSKGNIIATLPAQSLESLRRVSTAMSSGTQGPRGVVLTGDNRANCACFMAANGATAACDQFPAKITADVELLLPDSLVKYLSTLNPSGPLKLFETEKHIILEARINDIHVSIAHSKEASGFPDLRSHFRKLQCRARIRFDRKVAEWVFKRAKKISPNAPAKVTLKKGQEDAVVDLIHTGEGVLFARYRNTFRFEATLPSDLQFTIKPENLLTFLAAIESERCSLEVFDRADPIRLSDGNFEFYVIQVDGRSYESPTNRNGQRNPIGEEAEFSLVES